MKLAITILSILCFGYVSITDHAPQYEPNNILRPPAPIVREEYPQPMLARPVAETVEAAPVLAEAPAPAVDMRAIVSAHMLAVRTGPGMEFSEFDVLTTRERAQVLETQGEWARVEFDGQQGWVLSKRLLEYDWREYNLPERDGPLTENSCGEGCVLSHDTLFAPAPQHIVGNAVMYAPGLMEASAEYNGFDLTGFVGGVAMSSRAQLGQVVWLRNNGGEWEGPYLVVDASGRYDVWKHIVDQGQSVEVDFDTAVRWGMASGRAGNWQIIRGGLPNIEVWTGLTPPDSVSPDLATDYKDYFLHHAQLGAQEGDNNQWTTAYAQFVNFAEYQAELAKLTP
jgi:hypothetical protein